MEQLIWGILILIGFVAFVLWCIYAQDRKDIRNEPGIEPPPDSEWIECRCRNWIQTAQDYCPYCQAEVTAVLAGMYK